MTEAATFDGSFLLRRILGLEGQVHLPFKAGSSKQCIQGHARPRCPGRPDFTIHPAEGAPLD